MQQPNRWNEEKYKIEYNDWNIKLKTNIIPDTNSALGSLLKLKTFWKHVGSPYCKANSTTHHTSKILIYFEFSNHPGKKYTSPNRFTQPENERAYPCNRILQCNKQARKITEKQSKYRILKICNEQNIILHFTSSCSKHRVPEMHNWISLTNQNVVFDFDILFIDKIAIKIYNNFHVNEYKSPNWLLDILIRC